MRPTFSRYRYFAKIKDGKPGSQIDAALNNAAFSWHFVGFSCIAPKAPKMGVERIWLVAKLILRRIRARIAQWSREDMSRN